MGIKISPHKRGAERLPILRRGAGAPGLCQRAFPPEQGLRGTERPRPLRKMGSLSAPRLCGDILMPMPLRLTSVPARASVSAHGGVDPGIAAQAAAG